MTELEKAALRALDRMSGYMPQVYKDDVAIVRQALTQALTMEGRGKDRDLLTRHTNLLLDLHRLAEGEATLCDFEEVKRLEVKIDSLGDLIATLPAPQQATPERNGEPVTVEAVATVGDCAELRWLIEGGVTALPPGALLLVTDKVITGDDGQCELYTSPQVPEDVQRDAERWRKFSGLDYKVRREWASNLSLVPVLTEWVDALPAIDAARKGE